jgi:hypothetical protein
MRGSLCACRSKTYAALGTVWGKVSWHQTQLGGFPIARKVRRLLSAAPSGWQLMGMAVWTAPQSGAAAEGQILSAKNCPATFRTLHQTSQCRGTKMLILYPCVLYQHLNQSTQILSMVSMCHLQKQRLLLCLDSTIVFTFSNHCMYC